MFSRNSLTPHDALRLHGAVDAEGKALHPDITIPAGEANDDSTIAPWLSVPPTPPPKPYQQQQQQQQQRSFSFQKPSFSSIVPMRQGSTSSLLRQSRPSESQSTLSMSDEKRRSADDGDSSQRYLLVSPFSTNKARNGGELRKAKSSMNVLARFNLAGRASKTRLRADSGEAEHPSLRPPLPHLPNPFITVSNGTQTSLPSSISSSPINKKEKRDKKKKYVTPLPPTPPPKDEPEFHIDTNFDRMDEIINLTLLSTMTGAANVNGPSSPISSGFDSSSHSHSLSDNSSFHINPVSQQMTTPNFSNPFLPAPQQAKRKGFPNYADSRKVSPKTIVPPIGLGLSNLSSRSFNAPPSSGAPGSPTWTPPESWAVEREGEDVVEGEYSSSEESQNGGLGRPVSSGVNGNTTATPGTASVATVSSGTNKRKTKRKKNARPPGPERPYIIRIYRPNSTYHVVSIGPQVSVASLTPALNSKLLLGDDRETHRLYLKERGRERVLAQTERPAGIVRRRLEQAGYDPQDGLELLGGEGLAFLLKFVYKSQLLGPADEELSFDTFDFIDLAGRSLRTIPVILHQHADSIISLKLSRNPMLEIPLDFIQSCTTLRELRLSEMAMKRVPHSLRYSTTLHRLDLSSNRIVDLDEAYLDDIPELLYLSVQNNRIEKLPWYLPRLRSLVTLNISNNKFRQFPDVVTQVETLRDLDISFNMIQELPDHIGRLQNLERLIIVGNQVQKMPADASNLRNLRLLDCRRNQISDLTIVAMLPKLRNLSADHNVVHALDLSLGPCLTTLDASHNDITQLSLAPGPIGQSPYALTSLDISFAKLSSLDDLALGQLSSLRTLRLDNNSFRYIPETLGDLSWLETLSCSDNKLDALPASIGRLQKLEVLDAHNNSLTELPLTLWNCASLTRINLTSNLLGIWHDPPVAPLVELTVTDSGLSGPSMQPSERKTSTTSSLGTGRVLPPLVHSLEKLYLGENRFTDDVLPPLRILKELRVLNLSFNDIQDIPPHFFHNLTNLEELYLSGNKLTSLPTEDLPRLSGLSVLFLNGNKLQTLPQELGKVKSLTVLDVGSNQLKYNINNTDYDWNWNFNKNLKYLNLSGNKRLHIKSEAKTSSVARHSRDLSSLERSSYSGFKELANLRVLGLMDVTITTSGGSGIVDIPDESDDRRIRTSLSTVGGMAYGIADSLGRNESLNMLDLVHETRQRPKDAIFAMFGRSQPPRQIPYGDSPNRITKFLHDRFVQVFYNQLDALKPDKNEGVPDAMRRAFLKLNQDLHDTLSVGKRKMSQASGTAVPASGISPAWSHTGASGIVIYFNETTMYAANVGNALAVVSRHGTAHAVSRKHDPFDRTETGRIRAAEGWVSPPGLVNDEVDISRSFGYFHLMPVVNARPDVFKWDLSEHDEFVIVANQGLWDYVPYQTAVDIVGKDRGDPMIASQKLRDFAISYGAEGSTMIMVIAVGDKFNPDRKHGVDARSRQPTIDDATAYSISPSSRRKKEGIKEGINDREIVRLGGEVPPPTGHLALVFTDIRNSTHLWEVNPGMPTAMRLHNHLLRRQLRICGGYEVKTEGDAFMCSFPNAISAVWFGLTVQTQLLQASWPLEILECEDGKEVHDSQGRLIARGLSVRMGIHCGSPVCEPDPITQRMDYFGPMVNRSARINGYAGGGQIACSAEIIREINASILETEPETEYSRLQPAQAVDAIKRIGLAIIPVGEVKLKGLEVPEVLSFVYPKDLEGRQDIEEGPADLTVSGSRVPFSVVQMRELGLLCLRLEALASARVFRPLPERKGSIQTVSINLGDELEEQTAGSTSIYLYGDPNVLLPPMNEKTSDADLMMLLDSLSVRIENALSTLSQKCMAMHGPPLDRGAFIQALMSEGELDDRTLMKIMSVLQNL